MPVLISFLRSVNITGHNTLKMTDLGVLFNELGFIDAESYIQSGNVIFSIESGVLVSDISLQIESAILERFRYKVPVIIRSLEEMRKFKSLNPFLYENHFEPSKMAVVFLQSRPTEAQIQKVVNIDYPPDKFEIRGTEIFIYCPNGFGKTRLYTNFFEKKMNVVGTSRNWNTITAILNIAEKRWSSGYS